MFGLFLCVIEGWLEGGNDNAYYLCLVSRNIIIHSVYLHTMNKKSTNNNTITIDFNVWCTQQDKAIQTGEKLTTISQRVVRSMKGTTPNPVEYWHIEQLGLTLVKK